MATTKKFIFSAIVAIALPLMTMATEYTVGDDKGWTVNYDYHAWANNKVFRVGDTLVFNYNLNYHNVVKVNAYDYKHCNSTGSETLNSGKDLITLKTPGRKWYICGVANHCSKLGMKLTITVEAAGLSPAPAPTTPPPPNAACGHGGTLRNALLMVFVAFVALFLL